MKSFQELGIQSTTNVSSIWCKHPLPVLKNHCQDLSTLPSHSILDNMLTPTLQLQFSVTSQTFLSTFFPVQFYIFIILYFLIAKESFLAPKKAKITA